MRELREATSVSSSAELIEDEDAAAEAGRLPIGNLLGNKLLNHAPSTTVESEQLGQVVPDSSNRRGASGRSDDACLHIIDHDDTQPAHTGASSSQPEARTGTPPRGPSHTLTPPALIGAPGPRLVAICHYRIPRNF